MDVMKTVITYKKDEEWIYNFVKTRSGKGNWVKDIIKDYLQGKLIYVENMQNKVNNYTNSDEKTIDLSEFGTIFDK